jgi:hypothetical protein
VDATNVYWIDSPGLYSVPIGGGPKVVLNPSFVPGTGYLAVDSVDLYATGPSFARIPLQPAPFSLLPDINTIGVAVDAVNVYWADSSGDVAQLHK